MREERGWVEMYRSAHTLTHSSPGVSHSATQVNQGSDLGFYPLSTTFRRGYYYYLYIYKSRFQADRFHIRFLLPKIVKTNSSNTYMDPRATA